MNKDTKNIVKDGAKANAKAPDDARINATNMTFFSLYFSTNIPAGIDMIPYAEKKAKVINPKEENSRLKLSFIPGFSAPKILVRNEITKNTSSTKPTIKNRFFI